MFVSQANRTKDCLIREKKLQNKPWLINNHLNAKSHSNQCAFHLSTQYTTMLYWSLNSTSDQIKSLWGNGRGSETSVHPSTVTVWQIKQKPSWIHTADAKSTGFRKHALSQSNTTSRVYIWAFTVTFQRQEDTADTKPIGFRKHALAQSNTTFRFIYEHLQWLSKDMRTWQILVSENMHWFRATPLSGFIHEQLQTMMFPRQQYLSLQRYFPCMLSMHSQV